MDLIKCNATEPSHCKWLTLTYADAMTDHTKVYEDGKMFLRRLQRYLNKSEEIFDSQKTFKRITVAEPQGEVHGNSWHLHILLIFNVPAPFIENEVMAELWGYGITDTHKVYDAEGLAIRKTTIVYITQIASLVQMFKSGDVVFVVSVNRFASISQFFQF